MHISSFFSNCLGAAPTFDVDLNIYCSLALRRRFANPQFEEEGKTKVGCWGFDILGAVGCKHQGVGGLKTWVETFHVRFLWFDIFVFFVVVFMFLLIVI